MTLKAFLGALSRMMQQPEGRPPDPTDDELLRWSLEMIRGLEREIGFVEADPTRSRVYLDGWKLDALTRRVEGEQDG